MWDWLFGTRRVWVEIKVLESIEVIVRKLRIQPFSGVMVYQYESIQEGVIQLQANGKGTSDKHYVEVLRWAPLNHHRLRKVYSRALTIGELDRKWK